MYGTRYILRWESEKYNHDYKILIKERDYTGVAENKSLGAAPLLRRDDSDSGISGTSLEMVVQADVDGELTSLYTVDNKLFLVELYKNGVLIWTGYVLPEKYSEPYISVPYDVSVTASDGLGILKNIQYAQTGTRSIFEIIKYCCDQTSLPLGFEISFSLLEKSMSSMESVLHQATLNTGTFNGMTCYEVLEECMTSLDCFITQSENGWLICSLVDVDKGGDIYNNQGTKTGNGKREKMVLGSTGEDCYPLGSLTNEIIPASKVATFIYDYNKRPSFLSNYDFRKGLEGWIAGGKAIYSHSVNDVHFVNLSEKGSVYQQIGVEKTTQVLSIAVNYCSSTTPIYWGGNIPETGSFNITIKLTDGTTTKYLSLEEGWRDAEYSFPRSSTTKKLQMFQRYPFSESDFEKLEITADGFPFSGKLEIKFQDTTNLGNVTNHVTNVVVTHIVSGGIDVEATLVEAASENHGEVKIAFGDTPFTENADLLFNNVLHVKNGGFTSEWMIGEKTDSFLYTLLKSTCSRIGFPRRQLTGVIQGRDLHTFMLLSDKYSDTLFHVTSAALNLLADEMDVTLEQFMPYRELSGETIESARVTGGNTSEYRSSGENETRVYQSGAGVPMRIRDLSPSELKPGSVIEVDRTNVAKSGKATLQELLGFILETGSVWTEEKLKVIKGYILYLGEKIKAGDSDLWAGNSFEDYLDQPVRKSDDVKFNSVTSTDFESKLKGWIIDALGDAEFRKLILREGFKTADFIPGVVGAGTGMVGTEDFTTGKLTVRNYMEVMALAVAQVFWRGGRDVHSPSGMKVNKVKEYPDYWRCYMETSEGQKNTCTIGAQMRCDKYGDGKEKYYWNLVMGIGEDYIDLSKTDRDGVDVPEVGDELAQFGHRTDPNLSWILVISSMMEDAGMTMYAGVNSYTLSGKWAISMGKDPNGSNRVGVFTKNGEFSDIIEGLEEKIQDAIVKTIDITASSQVFKYGPGFTGNPIPATITLTAMASKIAPESYQWQFLHGTGWVNIESATKKTLDVMPGDPVLFPSGTNVRSFRCVCNGDESFTDVFTLAKLADGAAGKPGTDGKGISSTAVTYQASTNGTTVPSGTWENTIPSVSANQYLWTRTIITYTDGTTSTSYSIGKIGATGATGAAGKGIKSTAVTYQASTSGTTVPTGTWGTTIPSVSANQYLWTRTIITYTDNTTSTSYSIGKMGANGMKGDKGDAGRGISSTAVTYQASTNGTTVPSGTWENTIPSVSANQYLWTRTIITYTDGTTSTSYSIGKIGATGATGAAGKGIKSTAVTYQASTSGTTVPTGTWGTTIPSVSANQYLWTRTIITYTDNTTSTSYSIGKMGATGAAGAAGKDACTVLLTNEAHTVACDANGNPLPGELAKATTKATAYKGTTKLTGVSTTGDLGAGKFSIGTKQETGGTFAWNGVDGVKCTTMTADTASCTFRVYLESASVYVEKTFIVTKAKSGENYWKTDVWLDASSYDADKWIPFTGTPLSRIGYNRICVSVALNSGTKPAWSTHNSGFSVDFDVDMQASGWGATDAQTLIYVDTFKFCSSSPVSCGQMTYSSTPVLYLRGGGKYHVKTDFPVTWTPRPDGYTWTSGSYTQSVSPQTSRPKPVGTSIIGRGVRSVANKYAVSSSNTTAPTSWSDTVPATTTTNRYLWNYEIITYTDGTTAETNKRVIGVHGATGATGVGIKSITEYYLASASASGVTASTSGWTTGMQVTTTTKKYLWNYEIVTYTDNSKYTSTPVIIGTHGATGDKGDTGAAGKGVKSTAIAYQASSSGTTTPTGTWSSSIPAVAAGQYLWTRTIITYTDNTTSTMYSVGRMGTNGMNGNAGNGVSSTTITYQASTSGTTAPTGTWSSSIPTVAAGSYLWTRTIISYTNGTSSTIYSVGKMGNTGAQGQPGESINGKMLYRDPEFKVGLNGTRTYGAQNGGGTVVISRTKKSTGQNQAGSLTSTEAAQIKEKLSGSPYSESDWCLYIKCHGGTSTGHLGGFYFGNQSRANAVFIVKVSAKIPVGYTLKNAHNSHGTGYKQEFLTPMVGTGKYETYIFKETCGPTGTFNTVNHLYLSGPVTTEAASCEWFVDYATVFDQTSDGYADIEIVTKDSFAVQLGFTNFEALKANALTKGPLIKAGLINADVIDVNTLAANNAFIDKLRTNILKANVITANMISVIGFTFADNKIIGGKDFGVGPGVKVTSTDSEKSFKAYKDASNYISMYYNSASDWGLKGVVGGAELLKLGITNKLGPFAIEGSWLRGSNLALSGSQLNFSYSGHQVYVGSHPDMTTAGNAKLGTFMLSGGGYGGLGSNKQVALIAGAPNNGNAYAMAVTQGMLKIFPNVHIVSGVFRAYMTGTNPGITLGNEYPNIICLYGTGNRKKVNLYAGMEIGSHFFITSEASQGFDVLCTGSERFYRNGNTYVAVQSSGQDTVLVMKTDTYKWTACQLPINWLGTWNP
jgi:hypothetical protein